MLLSSYTVFLILILNDNGTLNELFQRNSVKHISPYIKIFFFIKCLGDFVKFVQVQVGVARTPLFRLDRGKFENMECQTFGLCSKTECINYLLKILN